MALRSGQPGWRRVRAPRVALTDDLATALVAQWQALGLDPHRD